MLAPKTRFFRHTWRCHVRSEGEQLVHHVGPLLVFFSLVTLLLLIAGELLGLPRSSSGGAELLLK